LACRSRGLLSRGITSKGGISRKEKNVLVARRETERDTIPTSSENETEKGLSTSSFDCRKIPERMKRPPKKRSPGSPFVKGTFGAALREV